MKDRRRDENVWEGRFCFRHGYLTGWDQTCEGFRAWWSEDCDVAPATVKRNEPVQLAALAETRRAEEDE